MRSQKCLEVCADSLESALAAQRGGADRLELCANLVIGGTTPGLPLFRRVRRETGLKVHVLLRPRFGDFLYTEAEYRLLLEEAEQFLKEGADGIVCGFLLPDGSLDASRLKEMVRLAHESGASFTLHRAFDVCRDPLEAWEICTALSVDRVLTSGGKVSCTQGIPLLRELSHFREGPRLLAGAGVDAGAIRLLGREVPGLTEFHMSGKTVVPSAMRYRKEGVSMGLPALSEFELWRASEEKIRAARQALEEL